MRIAEKTLVDLDSSDFLKYDLCYTISEKYHETTSESFNCVTEKIKESIVTGDDGEESDDVFIEVNTYSVIPCISIRSVLELYGKKILAFRE